MKRLMLFLALISLSSFIWAKHDKTYEYLLQSYMKVCLQSDQAKKIEELTVLLIECETYKQGLPAIPSPAWSFLWSLIWTSLVINRLDKQGFLFYCYCLLAFYHSSWFLLDLSRFRHKDKIIQKYAQLDSLIAGIETRLSKKI